MLLRTAIRSSAATILLPFLMGFVFVALGDDLSAWVTFHYWPSATGSSTFALPFVAAACAAAAAWEGARLHRGRVFDQAPARSQLAITAPVLAPVAVMGLLGMLAALLMSATAADVGLGIPQFGIVLVVVGVLAANTLVGYIVGRVLPGVLAAPLALIGSFFVNAYPSSWSIYWLRHLVGGGLDSCCSVDTTVDSRALLSAGVFTTAVCLAVVILIQRRGSATALVAAVVVSVGGFGAGAYIARDLSAEPLQARSPEVLICEGTQPRICLWPEVADRAMVQRETRETVKRLERAGLQAPQTLTMAARPETGAVKLGIPTDPRAGDIPGGVASGLLPEPPACALEGEPYPAGEAGAPVAAWLYATAGAPADSVAGRFGQQEAALAQKVMKQPRDVQLDWYQRNMSAMRHCGKQPQLNIAGSAT
ncbi:hypothetical protein QCN29_22765 [Streptomyces sp. HNM0663]|uniref:DUF7224 domain-containing protein n=1 Tax=Streptomyces chengmaiensis TaxID=3040919 RepID=A0ABT6HUP0_9ACTN|nr:hypothetical protein [Streptomyces chengmaiensis]MDH2391549.1 hypothetical protein [Streptomyces chengmaiensis]